MTTTILLLAWALALYPVAVAIRTRNVFKVWDAVGHSALAAALLIFFGLLIAITWEVLK